MSKFSFSIDYFLTFFIEQKNLLKITKPRVRKVKPKGVEGTQDVCPIDFNDEEFDSEDFLANIETNFNIASYKRNK